MKRFVNYIQKIEFEYLIGYVLLSIMFYGLAVNTLLQKFGIKDPLSIRFTWPLYLVIIPLIIKSYIELKRLLQFDHYSLFLLILSILNPLLAVAGTIFLNNSKGNFVSILSIFLIILLFILTFGKKNVAKTSFILSLYSAALSLIFAISLRSNFLIGWDIHQEFLVFKLTSLHNLWDMSFFKDPYNACLSITILPTIIHNLTKLDGLIIFRIILPFVIALIPVQVYRIGTRFTNKKIAYVGSFAFLIQSQFFNQLPALLRQGLGFFFFSFLVDLILRKDLSLNHRKILFVLFSLSLVVSHYSTTYMTIAIFFIAKGLLLLSKPVFKKRQKTVLSIPVLIILLLSTFFWNTLITNTTRGLSYALSQVQKNIDKSFTLEDKSTMVKEVFYQKTDNASVVKRYSDESISFSENREYFERYAISPVVVDHLDQSASKKPISIFFHVIVPWIFRVSILIGFLYLLLEKIRANDNLDSVAISLAMLGIVLASIVIPSVSISYNLERILQQMLILLAPLFAIGFINPISRIKKSLIVIPVTVLLAAYLLQTTGLADHYIYGSKNIMLDNNGEQYLQYYTKKGEVQSLNWLDANTDSSAQINIDRYTALRLKAYSTMKYSYIQLYINPPVIGTENYVIAGNAGSNFGVVFSQYKNQIIRYSFPIDFVDQKNLIYSNSVSKIYR